MHGARLTILRKDKGMSQADLARRLGVNRALISGYERGKFSPSEAQLMKLADVFGVTTDYLLGRHPAPTA